MATEETNEITEIVEDVGEIEEASWEIREIPEAMKSFLEERKDQDRKQVRADLEGEFQEFFHAQPLCFGEARDIDEAWCGTSWCMWYEAYGRVPIGEETEKEFVVDQDDESITERLRYTVTHAGLYTCRVTFH